MHSFTWWKERAEGVQTTTDGFKALCPSHDDKTASLHVTRADDGATLVHCFAGCEYADIVAAMGEENETPPAPRIRKVTSNGHAPVRVLTQAPIAWLAKHCGVPRQFIDTLPLHAEGDALVYTFDDVDATKRRKASTKEFVWMPKGCVKPPFWPMPDDVMQATITLTEGETDCIVLRFMRELGTFAYDAFAITGGASSHPNPFVFAELKDRGVERVILAFDQDEAGLKATREYTDVLIEAGLDVAYLRPKLNSFLEKDIRDWYLRTRGVDDLEIASTTRIGMSLQDIEDAGLGDVDWLAEGYLARDALTLIAGYPKAGKSTLLTYMLRCLEAREPFFGVQVKRAKALLMTEEYFPTILEKAALYDVKDVAILTQVQAAQAGLDFNQALIDATAQCIREKRDVLIIDTLSAWVGFKDENDSAEVTRALGHVRAVTQGKGLCVILVHHMRKGGGDFGEGIRGSSALFALTEVSMEYKPKNKDTRVLETTSRYQNPPDPVIVQKGAGGLIEAVDVAEYNIDEARPLIDALSDGDLTVKQMCAATGLSEFVVRRHLDNLEELGKVSYVEGARRVRTYSWKGSDNSGGSEFVVNVKKVPHKPAN